MKRTARVGSVVLSGLAVFAGLALVGCTGSTPEAKPTTSVSPRPSGDSSDSTATAPESEPALSDFERQLPLHGTFVSQGAETTGTVVIERRDDATVWVTLSGFATGEASDLRLYLKPWTIVQNEDGFWVNSVVGEAYEIASIDAAEQSQQIEVPGAGLMPEIQTVTVSDYRTPDYPALGSASLLAR